MRQPSTPENESPVLLDTQASPIVSASGGGDFKPRCLIGCESSGRVRDAFTALGWDAWSCDILPTDSPGQHIQGDVRDVLNMNWTLAVFHPPCTYLCSSGMHWTVRGLRDPKLTEDALDFVRLLLAAPIKHIALENPVGCISTRIRKPDCSFQPWEHGHPESKKTCLWLKNLPPLCPTNVLSNPPSGRWENQCPSGQNKLAPSPDRWKLRSATYPGVAKAIANQFSAHALSSPTNSPPVIAAASLDAIFTCNTTPTVTA